MRSNLTYLVVVAAMLSVATGWSFLQETPTGVRVTQSAKAFVATLSPNQKSIAMLPADSPQRVDWHVIPKAQRKGLQFKEMNDAQRQAALDLLRSVLSPTGYDKVTKVMALEGIIRELEKGRSGGAIRDPERYYFTLFGEPSEVGRWGLSIEGHHLSLNFLVDSGKVIAATPLFLAANPNVVREGMPGSVPSSTRVLADEELLAFQLLESLDAQQRKTAILDAKAPRDVRDAGKPQSPAYSSDGLSFAGMNETQQKLLKRLIGAYVGNLPTDLASARLRAIEEAGYERVYFAWAGADRPGIGHYYRIQGPTFLIEFVNTQSDSAGILIGCGTDLDPDEERFAPQFDKALLDVLAEWNSIAPYQTRVSRVRPMMRASEDHAPDSVGCETALTPARAGHLSSLPPNSSRRAPVPPSGASRPTACASRFPRDRS